MQSNNIKFPYGLAICSLLIVLFWGLHMAQSFVIPLCMAALLSLMMAPLVRLMRHFHFPEWSAIALSSILLLLPFLGFAYILFWQGPSLLREFPHTMAIINNEVTRFVHSPMGQKLQLAHELDIPALIKRLEGSTIQGVQFVVSSLTALLGAGSQLALVLLFSILMLSSRNHIRSSTEKILTQSMSVENPGILDDVVELIETFLIARLLIVLIIGGIDFGILAVYGIPYSFLFASFLGLMTLLPAIGFLIAALPPIILAIANGFSFLKTVSLFLCLFIMSFVEGNILTPKMVGNRLNINALTTFIGLFAGGLIWGIWGMFLSIPILGVLRIIFCAAPSLRPWGELMSEKAKLNGELTPSKADKKAA